MPCHTQGTEAALLSALVSARPASSSCYLITVFTVPILANVLATNSLPVAAQARPSRSYSLTGSTIPIGRKSDTAA